MTHTVKTFRGGECDRYTETGKGRAREMQKEQPEAGPTWLLSRASWTTRFEQPAWQGVRYSTWVLGSQTGLKSSDGQEQGSMQPGKSSSPRWVLVGKKARRVDLARLPSGHQLKPPQPSARLPTLESNGQRVPVHTGFSLAAP